MLVEGNILYFTPFYFKNGNQPKSKFFVVLKSLGNHAVLASLPTSVDAIPSKYDQQQGCLELPEIGLNCYVVHPNIAITECGKFFQKKTHLFGHQLDEYSTQMLNEVYPTEGIDYTVWGKLRPDVFQDLLDCFRTSQSVKRKYKRIL